MDYHYRVHVLNEPEEDSEGLTDTEGLGEGAYTTVSLPFDDDAQALMGVALEQVGVFDADTFTIEPDESSGFVVRDGDGEPFLTLERENEQAGFDEGDNLYCSYSQTDEGEH